MSVGGPEIFQSVISFLERQKLEFSVTEEQYCDTITVESGTLVAYVSVYNSRKIVLGGKDTPLKSLLSEMKAAIEGGQAAPGQALPFEIDRFPETIQECVPNCDPVIIRFVDEAIQCLRDFPPG